MQDGKVIISGRDRTEQPQHPDFATQLALIVMHSPQSQAKVTH